MNQPTASTPEVSVNPHSDLPASGNISTEIQAPEPAERPLPFGVFRGQPVASVPPAVVPSSDVAQVQA